MTLLQIIWNLWIWIRLRGITNTGGLFGRDQDRLNQGYSLEHTGYFDGDKIGLPISSLRD